MTSTPLLSNRAILEYLYFRSFPQELGRFLLHPRKAMRQCLIVGLIGIPSSNHSTQKGEDVASFTQNRFCTQDFWGLSSCSDLQLEHQPWKLGHFEDGVLARIQMPLLLLIVVQRKSCKEGNGSCISTSYFMAQ